MIEINNTTKAKISNRLVRKVVLFFLQQMKLGPNAGVSIVFVGEAPIRKLNQKYRKQDRVTDILSFSNLEGGKLIVPQGEPPYLGEIIICYPQAKRQARELGHSVKEEIKILLVHGLLHLLGYEHEGEDDGVMRKMEEEFDKEIKIQ